MNLRLVYIVVVSFLFAQVSCAMSEGAEVNLAVIGNCSITSVSHDSLAKDGIVEHQDEMSGISHCIHSHPPMTFIFDNNVLDFEMSESLFVSMINSKHQSIRHLPLLSPPKA